jgi:kumamolisin
VAAGGTASATGTASGCAAGTGITVGGLPVGLSPSQFLGAYGIENLQASGVRGQGMRVAIVDDSTYEPSWLEGYRSCFGLSDATAVTPHVIGAPGASESGETILDLSVMSAVAPAVDRFDAFMVDTAPNPDVSDLAGGMIAMFGAPLDASLTGGRAPHVVSASFGACEALPFYWAGRTSAVDIMENVLATGAGAGVSYVVSAGDSGASGCQHTLASALPPADLADPAVTMLSPSYPATSAWVTAVGGTNLTLDASNGLASSGAWNDMAYGLGDLYYGGGGGTSTLVSRPWYQAAGVPAGTMRAVPDVAAFADLLPGYAILGPSASPAPTPDPGTWQFIGGTSAATPLLAGAFLLLSQQALAAGQPAHGFMNPLLYQLGQDGSASILDITLGSIDVFGVGCCVATAGFDLASGWGSPVLDVMSAALAPPTVTMAAARSTAGGRVTLSAQVAPAAGEVREYRWDTDGDGATDQVTTTPELTVSTPTAGVTTVVLSVTTTLGRVSSGTAVVTTTAVPARLAFAG